MLIYYTVCVPCNVYIIHAHAIKHVHESTGKIRKRLPLKHHSSVLYLLPYNIESYDDGHILCCNTTVSAFAAAAAVLL